MRVTTLVELIGPKLILLRKNSYAVPPVALKLTSSPAHAVLVPIKLATGAGLTEIEMILLSSSQLNPLKLALAKRRKSVEVANAVVGL